MNYDDKDKKDVYACDEKNNNLRIDIFVSNIISISRNAASKLIKENLVIKNEIFVKKSSESVFFGDKIKILKKDDELKIIDKNDFSSKIKIIYEHENFIAINKPPFISVHRANLNDKNYSIVDWIIEKKIFEDELINEKELFRPGIVHRLDKETSGILLIAKNKKSQNYFFELFSEKKIKKEYVTVVDGKINDNGTINYNITRSFVDPTKMTFSAGIGKEASTEYKLIKYIFFENKIYSEIVCFPKTGRTHQIRVHLLSIGFPVLGDKIYGKKTNLVNRHILHASSVEFFYKNEFISIKSNFIFDFKNFNN